LLAVASSTKSMSLMNISAATQASPYTIRRTTQTLVLSGLLLRRTIGNMSYFILPAPTAAE
jgi:DNA-binding IclR family transcriptional regulator